VAAHDFVERALQRLAVQPAPQADRRRHVVQRRARFELVQEPQALLRERQRQRAIALDRHQRRRRIVSRARLHPQGQRGHCRRLEQRPHRQVDPQGLADLRHYLRSQQRMAAQLKEVVVAADLLDVQDLLP
jgi:hypothetical protein